jgi:serine/threonine protein kinase
MELLVSQSANHSLSSIICFMLISLIHYFLSGFVFEAKDERTNKKVAIKRTQKAGNVVSREYEVMTLLKDAPNVVQLVEFFYSLDQKQRLI